MKVIRVLAATVVLMLCVLAVGMERSEATEYCWLLTDSTASSYSYMKLGLSYVGDNDSSSSLGRNYWAASGVKAQVYTVSPFVTNMQLVDGSFSLTSTTKFEAKLHITGIAGYSDAAVGPQLNVTLIHMTLNPNTFKGTYTRVTTVTTSSGATTQKDFAGVASLVTCQ
ncbi:MAG: hypothetical protein HQK98_02440 [Nitrospirae bacterium]|nr:hypothetical protein [Nitrospirota bacterium]